MASRQAFQELEHNVKTSKTNLCTGNNVNGSDIERKRESRGEVKNSTQVKVYAPTRVSRPLRSHFADVVSEVIGKASTGQVFHIEEKKYDCEYDTHYAAEIMTYMRKLELRKRLPTDYLSDRTKSLNPRNRGIIVDWLIQVQHYLKLKQETLYLTVYIFDHFFVKVLNVATEKLQLVAITSVLIACKVEERFIPEFSVLLHLTDNAYEAILLVKMERFILSTLGFQLVMPDPMVFLNRCLQAGNNSSKQVENMSTFFIDSLLHDVKVCRKLLPSQMAASAFCLARKILSTNEVTWDETLEHYSGYKEEDMKETMVWMLCTVAESANPKCELQGARAKYSSKSTYQNLSGLPVLTADAITQIIQVWTGSEPGSQ